MEFLLLIFFGVIIFFAFVLGKKIGELRKEKEWKIKVPKLREDAIKQSRAVLTGQFSEQIAPYLPDFPYSPTEIRFIGKPIDFLVFRGMDEKNISEVIFVEVKSQKSKINSHEKRLKETIENKKVKWEEFRIP